MWIYLLQHYIFLRFAGAHIDVDGTVLLSAECHCSQHSTVALINWLSLLSASTSTESSSKHLCVRSFRCVYGKCVGRTVALSMCAFFLAGG